MFSPKTQLKPLRQRPSFLRSVVWLGPLFFAAAWAMPPKSHSEGHTFYIAGDFQGILAPCGCSSPMLGGIQRLGSALDQTPAADRVFLVNGGLLPSDQTEGTIQYRQLQMKAETLAETLKSLNVAAINLGIEETSRGQGVVESIARLSGNKLISASIQSPSIPQTEQVGDLTVLGLSAQSETLARDLSVPAQSDSEAIRNAPGRLVVLYRGNLDQAKQLAGQSSRIELIVYQTQGTPPQPERVGHALLVSPGSDGRAVLRLTESSQGFAPPQIVTLTPDFSDAQKVSKIYARYLRRVDSENLLAEWPREKTGAFAGSSSCLKCHADEGKVWTHSDHSRAYADLIRRGHGKDPDCVSCHVTGLSSTRGFKSLALTPNLANVTCESCHGPGAQHSLNPKLIRLPKLTAESCLKCHTADNSPNFNLRSYWAKIAHGHTSFAR